MECLFEETLCKLRFSISVYEVSEMFLESYVKVPAKLSVYFMLQSWHVSWYTLHLSNLFGLMFTFWANNLPIVFSVLKETLRL
jgi:hypothetical protein